MEKIKMDKQAKEIIRLAEENVFDSGTNYKMN